MRRSQQLGELRRSRLWLSPQGLGQPPPEALPHLHSEECRLAYWGHSRDTPESPVSTDFQEAPPIPPGFGMWPFPGGP